MDVVEIWREDSGPKSDWYIDVIFVENDETKENLPFPVFQWIEPNYHYRFIPYDTLLPQNDIRNGKSNNAEPPLNYLEMVLSTKL